MPKWICAQRALTMMFPAMLLLAGCTGSGGMEREPTVTASGTATYQGQPLEMYRIIFSSEGHRTASALIDADGSFVLGTNEPGDGAAPGVHTVALMYAPPEVETAPGSTVYVDPPPPRVKLPAKYFDPKTSGLTVEVPASGSSELKVEIP